jgi:hypothetical protein
MFGYNFVLYCCYLYKVMLRRSAGVKEPTPRLWRSSVDLPQLSLGMYDNDDVCLYNKLQTRVLKNLHHMFPYRYDTWNILGYVYYYRHVHFCMYMQVFVHAERICIYMYTGVIYIPELFFILLHIYNYIF